MKNKKNIIIALCFLLTSPFVFAQEQQESDSIDVRSTGETVTASVNAQVSSSFIGISITSTNSDIVKKISANEDFHIGLTYDAEKKVSVNARGYLEFDLSKVSIPNNATIKKVELFLASKITFKSDFDGNFRVYEYHPVYNMSRSEWEIMTSTLNNPSAKMLSGKFTREGDGNFYSSSYLFNFVVSQMGKTIGMIIHKNEIDKTITFDSKQKPYLKITYEAPADPAITCGITIVDTSSKLQNRTYDNDCNLTIGSTSLSSSNVASITSKKNVTFAGSGSVSGSASLSVSTDSEIEVKALNVQGSGVVSMEAGKSIILKPGFSASSGTNVSLKIKTGNTVKSLSSLSVVESDVVQKEEYRVKVYPNPTTDVLNISGNDIERVDVYNLSGRLVKSAVKSNSIDLQNLSAGLYLVKIKTAQGTTTERVMKK